MSIRRATIAPGMQFVIPLRPRGYALLVVVKYSASSRMLVGYCFGPARIAAPSALVIVDPGDEILIAQVTDTWIIDARWWLLGTLPEFDASLWPASKFARTDGLGKWFIEIYDECDPNAHLSSSAATAQEAALLPFDTLYDPVTLQSRLSAELDARELLWEEWIARRGSELRGDQAF